MSITKKMIDDLKAKEGDAAAKYSEAQKRRRDAEAQMELEKSGIAIGDEVFSVSRGKRTRKYIAARFCHHGWLHGKLVKKDGSASEVETNLYTGWEKA